jgi:hypothetical protein
MQSQFILCSFSYLAQCNVYIIKVSTLQLAPLVRVVLKTRILAYTWLSMVAEIGGYVGLLLGAAVVDIAFLMDRMWSRFIRN